MITTSTTSIPETRSLVSQLAVFREKVYLNTPQEIQDTINASNVDFKASFKQHSTIQVGDKLPKFNLPSALGEDVSSAEILRQGPILITFYRGEWCPFCNITLRAMQAHLNKFKSMGVRFVAISSELPNQSLTTTEKHQLEFSVLTDVSNKYARKLGIVFPQPDSLRHLYKEFGGSHDLKTRNGDDSFEVPMPSTFLVDKYGIVRNSFVEVDYTKRLEPLVALKWIEALK